MVEEKIELPKSIAVLFYAILLVLGISFQLIFGLAYRVWIDPGLTSVVLTLVGVGLAGIFTYTRS